MGFLAIHFKVFDVRYAETADMRVLTPFIDGQRDRTRDVPGESCLSMMRRSECRDR